jgi:hypothetical protein
MGARAGYSVVKYKLGGGMFVRHSQVWGCLYKIDALRDKSGLAYLVSLEGDKAMDIPNGQSNFISPYWVQKDMELVPINMTGDIKRIRIEGITYDKDERKFLIQFKDITPGKLSVNNLKKVYSMKEELFAQVYDLVC